MRAPCLTCLPAAAAGRQHMHHHACIVHQPPLQLRRPAGTRSLNSASAGQHSNEIRRGSRSTQACRSAADEDRIAVDTDPAEGRAEVMPASEAAPSPADVDVWASKPPWCQPWTIVLTGATIDVLAWKISGGSPFITGFVAFPIFVWWYLFLGVMPTSYAEYMQQLAAQERRQ